MVSLVNHALLIVDDLDLLLAVLLKLLVLLLECSKRLLNTGELLEKLLHFLLDRTVIIIHL